LKHALFSKHIKGNTYFALYNETSPERSSDRHIAWMLARNPKQKDQPKLLFCPELAYKSADKF